MIFKDINNALKYTPIVESKIDYIILLVICMLYNPCQSSKVLRIVSNFNKNRFFRNRRAIVFIVEILYHILFYAMI